jgi:transposase
MRKGIDGLAMLVQAVLHQDPFSGHLFVFRGRKANLIKIVYWDGTGLCLFTKRLEQGVFLCPSGRIFPKLRAWPGASMPTCV